MKVQFSSMRNRNGKHKTCSFNSRIAPKWECFFPAWSGNWEPGNASCECLHMPDQPLVLTSALFCNKCGSFLSRLASRYHKVAGWCWAGSEFSKAAAIILKLRGIGVRTACFFLFRESCGLEENAEFQWCKKKGKRTRSNARMCSFWFSTHYSTCLKYSWTIQKMQFSCQ